MSPFFMPGSFNAYTTRFFSPSYGFALSWNYWFNDAVSVASDLTAAQLTLQYWTLRHTWTVSLAFWIFLVSVNAAHVKAYGEMGKSHLDIRIDVIVIASNRVLARFVESLHYTSLHHRRHPRECWCEYQARIYWTTQLAYTRCPVCGWLWRVCESVCNSKFCL